MLGRVLAKVAEQDCPTASARLNKRGKRIQALAFTGAATGLDFSLDPLPSSREILRAPEQPRLSGLAVATGAACLLVVSLNRLRDSRMRNKADIRFVDPHSERDRRRDHHLLGLDECGLVPC